MSSVAVLQENCCILYRPAKSHTARAERLINVLLLVILQAIVLM